MSSKLKSYFIFSGSWPQDSTQQSRTKWVTLIVVECLRMLRCYSACDFFLTFQLRFKISVTHFFKFFYTFPCCSQIGRNCRISCFCMPERNKVVRFLTHNSLSILSLSTSDIALMTVKRCPADGHFGPFLWLGDTNDHSKWQTACDFLFTFITGPRNGPVLFCSLASVVYRRRRLSSSSSVTLTASGPAGRRTRGRSGGPTLHGGPVRLRPVNN